MPLPNEVFPDLQSSPTFSSSVIPTYGIAALMASLESDSPEGPNSTTDLKQVTSLLRALISSP